jgi:hypothetical protein
MLKFDDRLLSFDPHVMTEEERNHLRDMATDIILRGDMSHFDGPIFKSWCRAMSCNSGQALLAYSTEFTQRLLIAIVSWDDLNTEDNDNE